MVDIPSILVSRDLRAYLPADVKLIPAGRDKWRGSHCPLCQATHQAFGVWRAREGHLLFRCFACDKRGDVIDFVQLMNGDTTKKHAIAQLSTGTRVDSVAFLYRVADRLEAERGAFVLACDAPSCGQTREVSSTLEAAVLAATTWEIAPDGIAALCPRHA